MLPVRLAEKLAHCARAGLLCAPVPTPSRCLQEMSLTSSYAAALSGAPLAPPKPLSIITVGDTRGHDKVLLFDASSSSPVTSPPIGAFAGGLSPCAPRRSLDTARSKSMDGAAYLNDIFFEEIYKRMSYDGGEYLRRGLFPDVPKDMSCDGGEYLRHIIFPERSPFPSLDGGEYLRRGLFPDVPGQVSADGGDYLRFGLFPEVPCDMSLDGGEFLRYGLFPEVPKEMSVDGGEYLRHAIFPDAPAPAVKVCPCTKLVDAISIIHLAIV